MMNLSPLRSLKENQILKEYSEGLKEIGLEPNKYQLELLFDLFLGSNRVDEVSWLKVFNYGPIYYDDLEKMIGYMVDKEIKKCQKNTY